MRDIEIFENGIYLKWIVDEEDNLKLLHFSARSFHENEIVEEAVSEGFPFLGFELSGFDRPYERHGNKFIVTSPGYRMKYVKHEDVRNQIGRLLIFQTRDLQTEVYVDSYWQFYDQIPIIRIYHRIQNKGKETQNIEYISNFHYEGIEKEGTKARDEKMRVYIPHNSWQRELNWKCYTLQELGMEQVQPADIQRSSSMIRISNTGNWSTKEYLPMGFLENIETNTGLFWQIEHNGSWHWEIGDQNGHLYLALGGPNEIYSHWSKQLAPGEVFETVKAAVGVSKGGFEEAMQSLTQYRRKIRRENEDNRKLPVIFNDYMNCLWGKPTREKEFPLIDAAAEAGCEYYCIDAGWYADGDWWDQVGEWKESKKRFPNGLREITDYIRKKGMVPGVWLEPEVMGIHCELVKTLPDDWFFIRHGKRVYDRSRFQLDYRNLEVQEYMNAVVDRLVSEYGVGYIKMDYNIEPGIGTELYADSYGEGMLEHERAYLQWLDGLWERHRDLIIENCSSGGLRMDYAMLSRCSIQSTSDQDDYLKYAVIAANAASAVTPEQAAVWTYPKYHEESQEPEMKKASEELLREETIFNMVNAMLLRIHQSGNLAQLDHTRKELVKEGIQVYKQIRKDISNFLPFWPDKQMSYQSEFGAFGLEEPLKKGKKSYLAVWKRSGDGIETDDSKKNGVDSFCYRIELPKRWKCDTKDGFQVQCIYPQKNDINFEYKEEEHCLILKGKKEFMGRLFMIEKRKIIK